MLKFVNQYFILDRPDLAMFQRGQEQTIEQLVVGFDDWLSDRIDAGRAPRRLVDLVNAATYGVRADRPRAPGVAGRRGPLRCRSGPDGPGPRHHRLRQQPDRRPGGRVRRPAGRGQRAALDHRRSVSMADTMQAVVCHGPRDYRLEEVPRATAGPGEALVKVEAVGICASDLKCYHGAAKFWGDENRPAWAETEVIPGHEFVGGVVELDEAAADALGRRGRRPGDVGADRALLAVPLLPRGQYWMCAPHDIYGFKRRTPGAMAEYMVFPADALVHKISDELPAAHAAFIEPLSCALHAVERGGIGFEDVVVVAGCGPIGLGMVAGAAAKSPAQVDRPRPGRPQAGAGRAGAGPRSPSTSATDDVVGAVRDLTDGYGADVYLEGTGHPSAVGQGLQLLRKLGTFVEYSVFGSDVTVDWSIISDDKELDVLGAHLGPHCWPAAVRMLESGRLPMDEIVTHQLPLAEFQQGLDLVADGVGLDQGVAAAAVGLTQPTPSGLVRFARSQASYGFARKPGKQALSPRKFMSEVPEFRVYPGNCGPDRGRDTRGWAPWSTGVIGSARSWWWCSPSPRCCRHR